MRGCKSAIPKKTIDLLTKSLPCPRILASRMFISISYESPVHKIYGCCCCLTILKIIFFCIHI